ncbi:MAG: hydrogenase expression/formation protein HypE [Bacillota bacterium]
MKDKILLAHGDGGLLTHHLILEHFIRPFNNPILAQMADAARIQVSTRDLAFTTDSFVINPIFFPGGDIGKLAVCGTVNDLAVSGAQPCFLAASFIIEEGFSLNDLDRIISSMASTAATAGVAIVAGDTKVVERGSVDKIFVNTAGIGVFSPETILGVEKIEDGDVVIINGCIGEHGMAVLSGREGLGFETSIISDCACLNQIIQELMARHATIKFMRDPTRGGLAATINEIASASAKDIYLFEDKIPVSDEVRWAAEMLGMDPLYLANEGKFVIVASREEEKEIISSLRNHTLGRNAAAIGEIRKGSGNVYLKTCLGATKLIKMPVGQQLPRIC